MLACERKCVHFCRQVVIFILSRHVHPCAHDVFCLDLRDCDVCVVVVEGSSDTKIVDVSTSAFVEQHVCALDVTVN
jgi:hypothetical protein